MCVSVGAEVMTLLRSVAERVRAYIYTYMYAYICIYIYYVITTVLEVYTHRALSVHPS